MATELVPCPWCGDTPKPRGGSLWPWGLECSCGAMGPRGSANAEQAAEMWNGCRGLEQAVIEAAQEWESYERGAVPLEERQTWEAKLLNAVAALAAEQEG